MTELATIGYFYALTKLTKPKIRQYHPSSPKLDAAKKNLKKAMELEMKALKKLKQEHKAIHDVESIEKDEKTKNTVKLLEKLENKLQIIEEENPDAEDIYLLRKKLDNVKLKLDSKNLL